MFKEIEGGRHLISNIERIILQRRFRETSFPCLWRLQHRNKNLNYIRRMYWKKNLVGQWSTRIHYLGSEKKSTLKGKQELKQHGIGDPSNGWIKSMPSSMLEARIRIYFPFINSIWRNWLCSKWCFAGNHHIVFLLSLYVSKKPTDYSNIMINSVLESD